MGRRRMTATRRCATDGTPDPLAGRFRLFLVEHEAVKGLLKGIRLFVGVSLSTVYRWRDKRSAPKDETKRARLASFMDNFREES